MSDDELKQIITGGANKLGLSFDEKLTSKIVELSAGYPHFTHLLALKCTENAVVEGYKHVRIDHLPIAIRQAVNEAEGTLKRTYDNAVRSCGTEKYKIILISAARLNQTEFSASDLRNMIYQQTGESISQPSLTNYLKRLVSDGSSTILRRTAKGVYRFNDPRMPSYVKIANELV